MSVSQVLQELARQAGQARLRRAEILGDSISGLAQLPGQILADRDHERRQAAIDARERDSYQRRVRADQRDEQAFTAQQREQAVAHEIIKAYYSEAPAPDPTDPAAAMATSLNLSASMPASRRTYNLAAGEARARELDAPEWIPKLRAMHDDQVKRAQPTITQQDRTKDTYADGVLIKPATPPPPKTELDYAALGMSQNPVVSAFGQGTLNLARKPAAPKGYQHVDKLLDGKPATLLLDPTPGGKIYDLNNQEITNAAERVRPVPSVAVQIHNDSKNPVGDYALTGADFLKTIPVQDRRTVQAVADYKLDPAKVASMRSEERAKLTKMALQVNPGYDASQFAVRAPTRIAFTDGIQGRQINAINTAIGHLDQLATLGDQLNNSAFVPGNKLYNAVTSIFGSARVTSFDTLKDALAGEVSAVLAQSGATVSGIAEAKEKIHASSSGAQLAGYVQTLIPVFGSKLTALDYTFHQAMGADDPFSALSPESKRILTKLGFDPAHPTIGQTAPLRKPIPGVPNGVAESTDGGKTWKRVE